MASYEPSDAQFPSDESVPFPMPDAALRVAYQHQQHYESVTRQKGPNSSPNDRWHHAIMAENNALLAIAGYLKQWVQESEGDKQDVPDFDQVTGLPGDHPGHSDNDEAYDDKGRYIGKGVAPRVNEGAYDDKPHDPESIQMKDIRRRDREAIPRFFGHPNEDKLLRAEMDRRWLLGLVDQLMGDDDE